MSFKEMMAKKSVGFYLSLVMIILCLLGTVSYSIHISNAFNVAIVVLLPAAVLIYLVVMIKPIRYLEYGALAAVLIAFVLYITSEASYISVCMVGIDAKFTAPYLLQIILMSVLAFFGIFPPIFRLEKK